MTEPRWLLLGQAVFATFLWSASKIMLKIGLDFVSPLTIIGIVQAVAAIGLWIFTSFSKTKVSWTFNRQELGALVILGWAGFVIAPVLSIIGLNYVAGTTAGLVAGLGSLMVMSLSWVILKETPRWWQISGAIIAGLGAYLFLGGQVLGGSAFGLTMLFLAELGYALNIVLTRLIMRRPGDDELAVALVGTTIGAIVLLPAGLTIGGTAGLDLWQPWVIAIGVGLMFALAGVLWNSALNLLLSFEVAILQNTMIVQVAILSAIFLHESITWYHIAGAIIVIAGAFLVNHKTVKRKAYGAGGT
ncbi:MAG: DMT family transporter [Patescibacteria group bacterium]|nr:DMT family transporter [Patescibacteria group bacterium]